MEKCYPKQPFSGPFVQQGVCDLVYDTYMVWQWLTLKNWPSEIMDMATLDTQFWGPGKIGHCCEKNSEFEDFCGYFWAFWIIHSAGILCWCHFFEGLIFMDESLNSRNKYMFNFIWKIQDYANFKVKLEIRGNRNFGQCGQILIICMLFWRILSGLSRVSIKRFDSMKIYIF